MVAVAVNAILIALLTGIMNRATQLVRWRKSGAKMTVDDRASRIYPPSWAIDKTTNSVQCQRFTVTVMWQIIS